MQSEDRLDVQQSMSVGVSEISEQESKQFRDCPRLKADRQVEHGALVLLSQLQGLPEMEGA